MMNDIVIMNDDCSRIEIMLRQTGVHIFTVDKHDYSSSQVVFSKIKLEQLIDTLVAFKENMD